MNEPEKAAVKKMLERVNEERHWVVVNKVWLLALVVAAVIGFLIGHVV